MRNDKPHAASDSDIRRAAEAVSLHANKYSHGRVLVLANGSEWRGAAIMAANAATNALAALRAGSGYVTLAGTKTIINAASVDSPVFVLLEIKGNNSHADVLKIVGARHDAIVVGPGIDPSKTSRKFFEQLIWMEVEKGNRIVVDAGAIHLLYKAHPITYDKMVITPHEGEFKELMGVDLKGMTKEEKIKRVKSTARLFGCTVVLKGHETIITDGDRLKINYAETPALATMGTGDVLSGIIASFAASHKDVFESAVASVRVHSLVGDTLFKKKGEHIIATDIIEALPDVLKGFDVIKK